MCFFTLYASVFALVRAELRMFGGTQYAENLYYSPQSIFLSGSDNEQYPYYLSTSTLSKSIPHKEWLQIVSSDRTNESQIPQYDSSLSERNFTSFFSVKNESIDFTYPRPGSGQVLGNHYPKLTSERARVDIATDCECVVSNNSTSTEQRRHLSAEVDALSDVLDATGATTLFVSSVYIASTFAETFKAADAFSVGVKVENVYIVASLLGGIWTTGLLVVVLQQWSSMQQKTSGSVKPAEHTESMQSVVKYVTLVVPAVFCKGQHWTKQLWQEIVNHHVLFRPFTKASPLELVITGIKTLTEITFMLFLVAVFFDVFKLQGDGSCSSHYSLTNCERRTAPFVSYCKWAEMSDMSGYHCIRSTKAISYDVLFYLSILTTTITSVMKIPIDYLFAIINAPTASELMVSAVSTLARGARRLSHVGASVLATIPKRKVLSSRPSSRFCFPKEGDHVAEAVVRN